MAVDDDDEDAARLTEEYAALKIEHAHLASTAHTARELESHVSRLRAHVQRLHACIDQRRHRSTSVHDTAVPPPAPDVAPDVAS